MIWNNTALQPAEGVVSLLVLPSVVNTSLWGGIQCVSQCKWCGSFACCQDGGCSCPGDVAKAFGKYSTHSCYTLCCAVYTTINQTGNDLHALVPQVPGLTLWWWEECLQATTSALVRSLRRTARSTNSSTAWAPTLLWRNMLVELQSIGETWLPLATTGVVVAIHTLHSVYTHRFPYSKQIYQVNVQIIL